MQGSKRAPVFWSLNFCPGDSHSCMTSCLSEMAFVINVYFPSLKLRFPFKAEKNLQLQRWMWQLRLDVKLLTYIKSTLRGPNMHFGERRIRKGKKLGLQSGSLGFSRRRIFVLFRQPSRRAAEAAAKMKKGWAASLRFFTPLCIVRLMSSASLLSFCNQHFEKVRAAILPHC